MLSVADGTSDLTQSLAENLRAQGMHVDTKGALLFWLIPVYLWSVPPMLFFLPLTIWMSWTGWTWLVRLRRAKIDYAGN